MAAGRLPLTAERIEALRAVLHDGTRRQKLDAMHEAAVAHADAAALVPDIAAFLTSEDYVRVEELKHDFSGHSPLATAAMGSIEAIGIAPELEVLRRLLDDWRLFVLPEASYDQGAYIGDYSSETVAPAALAARLVPLLRERGFELLPELLRNVRQDPEPIWQSAARAIERLLPFAVDAKEHELELLAASAIAMSVSREATVPTTARGFMLRDLGALCSKRLNGIG